MQIRLQKFREYEAWCKLEYQKFRGRISKNSHEARQVEDKEFKNHFKILTQFHSVLVKISQIL